MRGLTGCFKLKLRDLADLRALGSGTNCGLVLRDFDEIFRQRLLVQLGIVFIGLLDVSRDILQPELLHVFVVIQIQLVIYNLPGLWVA